MNRRKVFVLSWCPRAGDDISAILRSKGVGVASVLDENRLEEELASNCFDGVIIELASYPDNRGCTLQTLGLLTDRFPDLPVVACGAEESDLARKARAAGAIEFVSLPVSAMALALALSPILECNSASGSASADRIAQHAGLMGMSSGMNAVRERIARIAPGDATVLVRGESGTGKELVARALHVQSMRREGPFVRVHASALPDALLESELFGYEKGAFTGATARKAGRVELAESGTLFFDEIGELSPAMQVKLLRLLQEREYELLGGTRTISADVRFVAATHRDLEHMVDARTFREDLFYRLNVVSVWLPPLRARREDVAQIAKHYLRVFRENLGKPTLALDELAIRALAAQRWPGNVRQLVNFVERLVVLAEGDTITFENVTDHLNEQKAFLTQAASGEEPPQPAGPTVERSTVEQFSSAVRPLHEDVRRAERRALVKALHQAKGNRALAARMLGISRRTLYTKLGEHDLG